MKRSLILGTIHGAAILGVVVLGIVIAWAADILTVDKDGTVRLRVSATGKVTLNTAEAAEGDLRFTPRASDPTASLEGDLWYNAGDATFRAKAGTDILNLPGRFTQYTMNKTDGDFTTSSTSWVDVTGLSVTFTTDLPNQVIQISTALRGSANTATKGTRIDFAIDGTRLSGGGYGIVGAASATANASVNLSATYLYAVPSTGTHTVAIQTFADPGVANTILANSAWAPAVLQVLKFY